MCRKKMTHARCCTVSIVRESTDDDRDSSGEISLIVDFFDFFLTRIDASTTTDGAIDHIDGHSCFFRGRNHFCEMIIFFWICAPLSCEGDELGMDRIYFRFYLCSRFFLGCDGWSSSHKTRSYVLESSIEKSGRKAISSIFV
jgi:hypothetical protein